MGDRLVSCSVTYSRVTSAGHMGRHMGSSQKAEVLLRPRAGASATVQGWISQALAEAGWYGIL